MKETGVAGVFRVESEEEVQRLLALLDTVKTREEKRLQEQHPEWAWWPHTVFALRDLNSFSELLSNQDNEHLAELVGTVVTHLVTDLLLALFDGDNKKVADVLEEIVREGKMLDAIFTKEVTQAQEH